VCDTLTLRGFAFALFIPAFVGTEAMLFLSLRPLLQNSLNVRFPLNDLHDVVADSIVQLLGPKEVREDAPGARQFFACQEARPLARSSAAELQFHWASEA
jgi:hypothetical protein